MEKTAARMLIWQVEKKDENILSETIVIRTNLIVPDYTQRESARVED